MKAAFRSTVLLAGISTVAALGLGCASAQKNDRRLSNADVSLISFGSLNGEVAPCG